VQISSEEENNIAPIYMRYPIFIRNTKRAREKFKRQNIFLDDGWHTLPVVPLGTDLEKMNYIKGNCPKAEKIAKVILNLPTGINISREDIKKILEVAKTFNIFR